MAFVGFTGFFVLVTIGCLAMLGLSVAENWKAILSAINGREESDLAARRFTTSQCSPAELPAVAQRMVLHELRERAEWPQEEQPLWAFSRQHGRGRQMAFNFA